jgi:predicted Zn-dependent protease with MMP-like domain
MSGHSGVVLGRSAFEAVVDEALDAIPRRLLEVLENVAIIVEDEPPSDEPDLLGLYEGTPITERDQWWGAGSLPDRILIFQGPLQRMCSSLPELREEIAVTVVHEIAHYFGIDDDRLHELGWG